MAVKSTINSVTFLWQEYKTIGSDDLRNKLIEYYLPIVKYQAQRIKAKLPECEELDDLISAGVFGLIETIEGFNLSYGVKFESYCVRRIRGSILDDLRRRNYISRQTYRRISAYNDTVSSLSSMNGDKPSLEGVAEYMGVSLKTARRIERMNIEKRFFQESDEDNGFSFSYIEDNKSTDPFKEVSKEDGFNELIAYLPHTNREIFILYYRQGLPMKKIGELFGLSESAISLRHTQAIKEIRDALLRNNL